MDKTKEIKKITLGGISSWIFGIIFGIIGICAFTSSFIVGIVLLIMASVLLPPVNKIFKNKMNFELSKGIKIIVIIIGFIIVIVAMNTGTTPSTNKSPISTSEDKILTSEGLSRTSTEDMTNTATDVNSLVPVKTAVNTDIRQIVETWTNELPTEYRLENIGSYCNQTSSTGCGSSDSVNRTDIIEGYSRSFSNSEFVGTISLYKLSNEDTADNTYNRLVDKAKAERGYTEIGVPESCFGRNMDYGGLATAQQVACYRGDLFYTIQLQGMYLSGTDAITGFNKYLLQKIEG